MCFKKIRSASNGVAQMIEGLLESIGIEKSVLYLERVLTVLTCIFPITLESVSQLLQLESKSTTLSFIVTLVFVLLLTHGLYSKLLLASIIVGASTGLYISIYILYNNSRVNNWFILISSIIVYLFTGCIIPFINLKKYRPSSPVFVSPCETISIQPMPLTNSQRNYKYKKTPPVSLFDCL
jgi:hypothetical protein